MLLIYSFLSSPRFLFSVGLDSTVLRSDVAVVEAEESLHDLLLASLALASS